MQINWLGIKNFKYFEDKEFEFDSHFNLVIGKNGSGKTSLLRAVAVAIGGWASIYIQNRKDVRPIASNEVREIQVDVRFEKTEDTCISAQGNGIIVNTPYAENNISQRWVRSLIKNKTRTSYTKLNIDNSIEFMPDFDTNEVRVNILKHIEDGHKFVLPLIAIYECDRLWLQKTKFDLKKEAEARYSRFIPYEDCFHTGIDSASIREWIMKQHWASFQSRKDTPDLLAMRSVTQTALENCTGIQFSPERGGIVVDFADGNSVPFEHLSDGQRTLLCLFCDIARRAAILNPHLGSNACTETNGVVLIDELDLHLHPKWQRQIIENLQKAFPKIQFICTTHSPFIIQSLRNGKLINLDDEENSTGYHDSSIEDIAEDIQGVDMPQKSQRYIKMIETAEAYYTKLHESGGKTNEEIERLSAELDELAMRYSDDPAFVAQLKFERETVLPLKQKHETH